MFSFTRPTQNKSGPLFRRPRCFSLLFGFDFAGRRLNTLQDRYELYEFCITHLLSRLGMGNDFLSFPNPNIPVLFLLDRVFPHLNHTIPSHFPLSPSHIFPTSYQKSRPPSTKNVLELWWLEDGSMFGRGYVGVVGFLGMTRAQTM